MDKFETAEAWLNILTRHVEWRVGRTPRLRLLGDEGRLSH